MKARFFPLLIFAATSLFAAEAPIDRQRAKDLFQRQKNGEKLSPDEQKYLDEAKLQRGKGDAGKKQQQTAQTAATPPAAGSAFGAEAGTSKGYHL